MKFLCIDLNLKFLMNLCSCFAHMSAVNVQSALSRLIDTLGDTDAGEAEKLTALLRGAERDSLSGGKRISSETQESGPSVCCLLTCATNHSLAMLSKWTVHKLK